MGETVESRLDGVEAQVMEMDDLRRDLRVAGEAIGLLRGMVADLVQHLTTEEQAEYAEDLERVDQLGHLLL